MKIVKFDKKSETLEDDRKKATDAINSHEKFVVIYMCEDKIGWTTNLTIKESIVASSIFHHDTQMDAFKENVGD